MAKEKVEEKKANKDEIKEAVEVVLLREKLEKDIEVYDKRIASAKEQLAMVPNITAVLNQNVGAKAQCEETLKRLKKDGS